MNIKVAAFTVSEKSSNIPFQQLLILQSPFIRLLGNTWHRKVCVANNFEHESLKILWHTFSLVKLAKYGPKRFVWYIFITVELQLN